jgi:DNA-binding NarL/FixJ family response regulator
VKESIRIFVAHSHEAVRVGVRAALAGQGFTFVGEAADAASAVRGVCSECPDVCLLDARLPGGGIAAAQHITDMASDVAVVLLSASSSEEELFAGLRAGALGYLPMDGNASRLAQALRGVVAGEAAVPRKLVSLLIDDFRSSGRRRRVAVEGRPPVEITSREWEALRLFQEGFTTAQVAERLLVSPVTVRRHVSSVVRKVGAPDRATAIRLMQRV